MKELIFFLSSLSFLLIQCQNTKETKVRTCELSIEDIQNHLLHKTLNTVEDFDKCFIVKDSLFEDDEGQEMTWPGKVLVRNNKESIIIETNWVDKKKIDRITVLDTTIRTKNGIHTGINFKYLRKIGKLEIDKGGPDGYLFVCPMDEPHIHIYLDLSKISADSKLNYGADSLDEIPESLIVSYIVIM